MSNRNPERRVGVMVIRLWVEKGRVAGLRARISRTVDVAARDETVTTATSFAEIYAQVRSWLHDFLPESTPRGPAPGPPDDLRDNGHR
jgi:hypothetical protein